MAPPCLGCLRLLCRYRSLAMLVGALLLFLPLPLLVPTPEARCAYSIILMAVYWCTEVIPLAVTSLLPVVLFPVFGIQESKKVCIQYLKDANMLFIGGLIVAVAVEHWNLHKRIALRVLLTVGVKPAFLMLGFMSITAFISMWISNTATTAMMVPIVQAVISQMKFFESEVPEVPVQAIPGTEMEGKTSEQDKGGIPEETPKEPDWEKTQNRINKGLTLSICYAASIGGTATLTGTGPNLVLIGQINELFPENNDVLNFTSWFVFAFPNMLVMLFLSWLWMQFSFIGFNLRKAWGFGVAKTEKEKATILLLKKEYQNLGPISFAEFSVLMIFILLVLLWFTRSPGFVSGWATVLFNRKKEYVTDATVAIFVALLLFIIPAHPPWEGLSSQISLNSEVAVTAPKEPFSSDPVLDWKVVQKKLPWDIILLLGGGFALANGCEASGLSKWLGDQMTPLQRFPPWVISFIISLAIATFTECTSNVAIATLFLPILASLSVSIKVNPLYIMFPATLSASFAFMLPVATPPNAIVFSYGHLKVMDMVKAGVVMNFIGLLCTTVAINTYGRAIFNLDTFPSWGNTTLRN